VSDEIRNDVMEIGCFSSFPSDYVSVTIVHADTVLRCLEVTPITLLPSDLTATGSV